MRNFLSKYGFTLGIILILVLAVVLLMYTISFNAIINANQDRIIEVLSAQAKRQLNVELRISSLNAEFPFSVSLKNIDMLDEEGKPLITIERAVVKADWLYMINNPDDAVSAIRFIQIDRPTIIAVRKNGSLNWAKLLSAKKPEEKALNLDNLNLRISINDCRVKYYNIKGEGEEEKASQIPIPFTLQGDILVINGDMVIHPILKVHWINGQYGESKVNHRNPVIQIRGSGRTGEKAIFSGTMDISDIKDYLNLLEIEYPELKKWDIKPEEIKGKFEVRIASLFKGASEIEVDLEINSSRAVLTPPFNNRQDIVFTNSILRYSYPGNHAQLFCAGEYSDSSFDMILNSNNIARPELEGNLRVKNIPIDLLPVNQIPGQPEFEGSINADVFLGGSYQNPSIKGLINSDNLKIENRDFVVANSEFNWDGEKLNLPGVIFNETNGGSISMAGYANPLSKETELNVSADGIDINFFKDFFDVDSPVEISGKTNIDSRIFAAEDNFTGKVNFIFGECYVAGLSCDSITGGIEIDNQDILIENLTIHPGMGGKINASGRIFEKDNIAMSFAIDEVDLSSLESVNQKTTGFMQGTLFGEGKINGTFLNPSADVSLRAYDGLLFGWKFERGDFSATVDSTGLKKSFLKLDATGSLIELNAEYLFHVNRPLVVWGNWENVPISTLTSVESADLMISGDGQFIGDADELNGIVNLSLDGEDGLDNRIFTPENRTFTGTFLNIDIGVLERFDSVEELIEQTSKMKDRIKTDGIIKNGRLEVSGGLIFESLAPEGELSAMLQVLVEDVLPSIPNLNLDLPKRSEDTRYEIPLDGLLSLDLAVERKSDSWLLEGNASGKDFKINNEQIKLIQAKVSTLEDGNYNLDMDFSQEETGNLSINGTFNLAEVTGVSPLDLALKINSYPISSLAKLAGVESGAFFDGLIQGKGRLKGSIDDLKLENIDLVFHAANLLGIPVEDSRLKFSWQGTSIDGLSLELKGANGFYAIAYGSIKLDPSRFAESYISLSVDNLPLGELKAGSMIPEGLKGNITSLVMQLAYDPNTLIPRIFIDLKAENSGYKWFEMDKIEGQGIIDGSTGNLTLGRLDGSIGSSTLGIKGILKPSIARNEVGLDLNIFTSNYDLLPFMEKMSLPLKGDNASMNVDLNIRGTTKKPLIFGTANAAINKPRLDNMELADSGELTLNFNEQAIELDGLINRSNSSLKASGAFDMARMSKSSNGSKNNEPYKPGVIISNLDNKPFTFENYGLTADILFKGKDGTNGIELSMSNGKARLEGIIDIIRGSYKVTPIPMTSGGTKSPVEMNLQVIVPEGFPITSGNTLDITLQRSNLQLTGTPGYPTAQGEITIREGHLRLLDRTFTISDASLQFKEFLGIDNPYLKGEASTIIVSRSIRNFQGTENLIVTAKINARLRQLSKGITFTSNRGTLSETELMGIVLRQDLFQDFQEDGLWSTLSQQAYTIPGAFVSRFFESKGGFQHFQIGVDFEQDVFLNMEYEVFEDVFLDFYYLFTSNPEYDIYLKYQFRPDSYIGVGTGDAGGIIIKLDYVIPLK